MSTATRVAGFATAVATVFALAFGAGKVLGPDTLPVAAGHGDHAGPRDASSEPDDLPDDLPGGLMVTQDGYTLVLTAPQAAAGQDVPVSFTIDGPDGRPVTAYDVEHEKRLHLIAVRRDFSGFQHVHPDLSGDGTWSVPLDLTPGQWRLFADFTATGSDALTLGADLAVAGAYRPSADTAESRTAQVDGYTVTLDGDLSVSSDEVLTLTVERDGTPVTDLEPYLGAYGHLVALRAGDLAYLHVHPDGAASNESTEPGPEIAFHVAVTSAGTYHLYLDFKHQGVVRTVTFTVNSAADDHTGH